MGRGDTPEGLILALLHKSADIEGPGWRLSRRHELRGVAQTSGGREAEEKGRKKCSIAKGMWPLGSNGHNRTLHLRAGTALKMRAGRDTKAHFKGKESPEARRRDHGLQVPAQVQLCS